MNLSWTDAKQACERLNSSLASVHSAEENEFIFRYVMSPDSASAAIGLSDIAEGGTFVWADGSDVSYTNWGNNEPNHPNGNYNCGFIILNRKGRWDGRRCTYTSPYICRKEIA